MFSKDLSTFILQMCKSCDLSCEEAAERCDRSQRYFDSIAREQANASLITFEKLCKGFEFTPNKLMKIPLLSDFSIHMAVGESRFICGMGLYPICPYCRLTLNLECRHS